MKVNRRDSQQFQKFTRASKMSKLTVVTVLSFVLTLHYAYSAANQTNSSSSLKIANKFSSTLSNATIIASSNDVNTLKQTNKAHFGNQADSSIFKPNFFKGLLTGGDRRRPAGSKPEEEEEEEEEVTKTIVMPIKDQSETGLEEESQLPSNIVRKNQVSKIISQQQHQQPKPEASLQLTSTEMNNILNDGEAPDFYRERERVGEGVFVGEEQNRLWTSASGGGRYMGGPSGEFGNPGMMAPSSFDSDPSFVNQRLAHAATESGFNHRFGSTFEGESQLAGYGGSGGRLMQSPNEYSEFHAGANEYNQAGYGASMGNAPIDYSPQSGLLRAGSGEMSPESGYIGSSGGGSSGIFGAGAGGYGSGGFSGYQNSPVLDRHASELYPGGVGAGEAGYGHSQFAGANSDLGSVYNGRLLSAGSHIPNQLHGAGFSSSAGDEYASRLGHGFDQRGFANQNNMMLRGNSMQSGMSSQMPNSGGEFKRGDSDSTMLAKLMPLTPIVPIADDMPSSNHHGSYREASNNVEKEATGLKNQYQSSMMQNQPAEVHESLDDDATEQGDDSGEETSSAQNAESEDESPTRATNARSSRGNGPSLVLNVPPPNLDNSLTRPLVDFARIGSAGYMAPQMRETSIREASRASFLRKNGKFQELTSPVNYDPTENPAHKGKYIID